MRILFIIGSLREGGAEGQLLLLMRGLRAKGHEVAVMLLRYEGRRLQGAEDEGFHIFDARVPKFRDSLSPLPLLQIKATRLRSTAFLKEFKPDLIHAHLFWAHYWGSLILADDPNTPFVTSRLQMWRADTKPFLERILENRVNKRVDCVIANAQSVADSCLTHEKNLSGKIEVIYNGIDLEVIDAATPRASNASDPNCEQIAIVNVANLHPLKGHDDLMAAHRLIRKAKPGTQLHLA
ncbi:MAG: glycosyltransferase, partial [Candidatus Sumerlaeota bacterium]